MHAYSQLLRRLPSRVHRDTFSRTPVSSRTIRRRLAEGHLGSRRPLHELPLTTTHRRQRLEWCRARAN
ncbi:hypothetical protein TNCV_1519541 [Trichonephila clavipes]|nr:hypothetical protein TNCV_1519541 [Trichonephila clavipes]